MDDPRDDPAIVVLLANDTSINQCLALPYYQASTRYERDL